jgi:hypothetical protein
VTSSVESFLSRGQIQSGGREGGWSLTKEATVGVYSTSGVYSMGFSGEVLHLELIRG